MLTRRIKGRGAKGFVEAHGEVLFAPGTDLSRWKNRFSHRILVATEAAAPTNKRPRWGHYGKPLKTTFTASTSTRITQGGGFFYIAVGSNAPHSLFVDQGTGIYGGNGPYPAKVLPPWTRGSASLYEHTWRPAGPKGHRVAEVMIRGQRGQHFFDTGLDAAFRSMLRRSAQLPGEGASGMAKALGSFPEKLSNDVTQYNRGNEAFRASLTEWRAWRDEAWANEEGLGRGFGIGSRMHLEMATRAAKQRQSRPKAAPKKTASTMVKPVKPPKDKERTIGEKRAQAVAQFEKQNPTITVLRNTPNGLLVRLPDGRPFVIPWSRILRLVD